MGATKQIKTHRLSEEVGGCQSRGIGRGERDANEVKMADLLNDMQASKTKHHVSLIRMFSQQDSKEYQNVEKSLGNVVMDISVKFTDDVTANEKMVTDVIRD